MDLYINVQKMFHPKNIDKIKKLCSISSSINQTFVSKHKDKTRWLLNGRATRYAESHALLWNREITDTENLIVGVRTGLTDVKSRRNPDRSASGNSKISIPIGRGRRREVRRSSLLRSANNAHHNKFVAGALHNWRHFSLSRASPWPFRSLILSFSLSFARSLARSRSFVSRTWKIYSRISVNA